MHPAAGGIPCPHGKGTWSINPTLIQKSVRLFQTLKEVCNVFCHTHSAGTLYSRSYPSCSVGGWTKFILCSTFSMSSWLERRSKDLQCGSKVCPYQHEAAHTLTSPFINNVRDPGHWCYTGVWFPKLHQRWLRKRLASLTPFFILIFLS